MVSGYVTARLDKVFHIGSDDALSWDIPEEPLKDSQGRNQVVSTPREVEAQNLKPHILREERFEKCHGETGIYAVVDVDDSQLIDGIKTRRASTLRCTRRTRFNSRLSRQTSTRRRGRLVSSSGRLSRIVWPLLRTWTPRWASCSRRSTG